MSINHYKEASRKITSILPSTKAYLMYIRLMEIFVQDCSLPVKQPFFGNEVKRKSKVIFELQEHFLNFRDIKIY